MKKKKISILDSDLLYRRIRRYHISKKSGAVLPSAFQYGETNPKGISVELAKLIADAEDTRYRMTSKDCPDEARKSRSSEKRWGVCGLRAEVPRAEKLTVELTPTWNPAHVSIRGLDLLGQPERLEVRAKLAAASELLLKPLKA